MGIKIIMDSKTINFIFEQLQKAYPNPQIELNFTNHYTLLVAVVLSAQTTDKGVNKATEKLFQTVQTPQDMIDLGEEGLKNHIRTIGLYNAKAKNVILLSQILIDRFGGQVPNTREDLESLPGVGRKTANVVLNAAFGQPTIAVDTHIFRVSNRLKLGQGKTPLAVEQALNKNLPEIYKKSAHYLLILHGRYRCKALKPLCVDCPLNGVCSYDKKPKKG